MTLDLRRARYFLVLVEERHFGRAARRLHIAQSSLSEQIRVLEGEVGAELLLRGRGGVELTPAGLALRDAVPGILECSRDALEATRRAARGQDGALAIGFMGSAGRELLPDVVRDFRAREPGVTLEVKELTLPESQSAVRERRVDVAFLRPGDPDPDVVVEPLPSDPLVALVPAGHTLAEHRSLPFAALAGERFVRADRESGLERWADFVDSLCARCGFTPDLSHEAATSVQAVTGLVAAGVGISVMSATSHTLPRAGVVTVPIEDQFMPLGLAYRPDASTAARAFVALTRELAGLAAPVR